MILYCGENIVTVESMNGKYKLERPEYSLSLSGEMMRQYRRKHKLSVEDVRRYMKLESVQAIYKWEKGKCFPTVDNLFALAELYQVSPEELLVKKTKVMIFWYHVLECKKMYSRKCIRRIQIYGGKLNCCDSLA